MPALDAMLRLYFIESAWPSMGGLRARYAGIISRTTFALLLFPCALVRFSSL